jgi:hypothetical protein
MPNSVLTIIRGDNIIAQVRSPEEIKAALRSAKSGRYVIEESSMAGSFLPSGYTCPRWRVAIRQTDGTVELEPEPALRRPNDHRLQNV